MEATFTVQKEPFVGDTDVTVVAPSDTGKEVVFNNLGAYVLQLPLECRNILKMPPLVFSYSELLAGKVQLTVDLNPAMHSMLEKTFFTEGGYFDELLHAAFNMQSEMVNYFETYYHTELPLARAECFRTTSAGQSGSEQAVAAKSLLCNLSDATISYWSKFPTEFAFRLMFALGSPTEVWEVLRFIYGGSNILIPTLFADNPNCNIRNAPLRLISTEDQEKRFEKKGAFWRLKDDDDFLPFVTESDASTEELAVIRSFFSGIFFRDKRLLATAIENYKASPNPIDWKLQSQLYSFSLPCLTKIPINDSCSDLLWSQRNGKVVYLEMGLEEMLKGGNSAVLLTKTTEKFLSENSTASQLKSPSHSRFFTNHPKGILALASILLLVVTASAYPVVYRGEKLTSLKQYRERFGLEVPPEGPYLVCFGSGKCIRRLRVGNKTMCGDWNCSDDIWPWRCPSPDRDIPCSDPNCTGCDKCHGVVQDGECKYFSFVKRHVRELVQLIPPASQRGLVLSETDAYFEGFSQFNDTVVSSQPNDTQLNVTATDEVDNQLKSWTFAFLSVSLVLSVLTLVVNAIRLHKYILERKRANVSKVEMEPLSDDQEAKNSRAEDVGMLDKAVSDFYDTKFSRTWLTTSPHISISALVTESLALFAVIGSFVVIGVKADFEMNSFDELPTRTTYLDYNLPSGCSCENPDTMQSQLTCNLPCEYNVKIGDRQMEMHFALAQTCVDKYLVVLDNMRERQCHYCVGGSASAWCRSLKNACEPHNCHVTDTTHQAWTNGCFQKGGSVHRIDLNYSIYPARYCTVSSSPAPGILGYPDTYYSFGYDSTLLANAEYIQAKIGGIWQDYKAINGGIGSQRAWLVPKNEVQGGVLVEGSSALESMWRFSVLVDNAEAGGMDIEPGLPEFSPVVFDQKCYVHITFNQMRCFTLEEACEGEYVLLRNTTYFKPHKTGMCGGVYMAEGEYTTAPSILHKCGNCTMAKECVGAPLPDDQCSLHIDVTKTGNLTHNATGGVAWVEVEQSLMGIVSMVAAIAIIIVVTLLIVLIIKRASHAGYQKVSA